MRPVIKVSLVLFILSFFVFMYVVMQGLNSIDAATSHHHDVAMASTIESACLSYITEYNRLPPSADNQKLTAALMGDNARHIVFLSPSKNQLNADGEIVDRWGTALQISFEGDSGVKVVSAGPDKTFDTPDDIVTTSQSNQPSH